MPPYFIQGPDDLRRLLNIELAQEDWITVSQAQIDAFAAATGDWQWIHCDIARAQRESPYGGTVAHGSLTLSLCPMLINRLLQLTGARQVINYGLNRVRFPQAVRAGSQVRLLLRISALVEKDSAIDMTCQCTIEVQGAAKPACVAELVLRVYF